MMKIISNLLIELEYSSKKIAEQEEEEKISICIIDVLLSYMKCIELKCTILSSSTHINERKKKKPFSRESRIHRLPVQNKDRSYL